MPAKKPFAISWRTFAVWFFRPLSRPAPTPRKRLFPPPLQADTTKPLANKGLASRTFLTVNGRITLSRRRYAAPNVDRVYPIDAWLDQAATAASVGVCELACRLNLASSSFDKAAEHLKRAAQVTLSGELLRKIVESEGRLVQEAADNDAIPLDWTASDGVAHDADGQVLEHARIYAGLDGVFVRHITEQEKQLRRQRIKAKRRRRGRKCQPLPRAKKGADQSFKELKIVTFYEESQEQRLVSVTRGDCERAGELLRRDAERLKVAAASERLAVVDGAPWIRHQLDKCGVPWTGICLDFYHLAENVHKARCAMYGAETSDAELGQNWATEVLHQAKHAGTAELKKVLWEYPGHEGQEVAPEALKQLANYVREREELLNYPEFCAAGRQIGSGPTEAPCKTTTARVKGAGKRWDGDNAESVMSLAALEQSGAWNAYWQERVYGRL